jgi:hypothetical protein
MGARFREDVEAFGHRACDQGVAVFAGHCGWATADWIESNEELDDAIKNALADVVWTFLDGENDAAKLRLRAEQSFDIVDRGFAAGVPFALHRMMQGLLVTGP